MPSRLHVYYSGHVQGVGFRYSAKQLSLEFDVTGWVKNLPDGRVEMVIEGERGEFCLLYTSPSPRDATLSRMPSSA